MKKTFKYTSIACGIFLAVMLIIAVVLKIYVTKNRVIRLIEENINARIEIKDISIPLWASFSGITIEGLKVGYRDKQVKKEPGQRKPMGQPVVGFQEFNFRVALLKLVTSFGRDFKLKTLLFTKPEAHIILYPKGGTNLDVLLAPPPGSTRGKEKGDTKKPSNKETKSKKIKKSSREPFSIKSINTVIQIGKVGIEEGNFSVNLKKFDNTLKLQNVDAYLNNILIDPKNLSSKNQAKLKFAFRVLLDEDVKKRENAVRSFVINFRTDAAIQPFHPKTGYVNQKALLKIGLLSGTKFTGLALLKKIKDKAKLLKKIGVDLGFLREEVRLNKDAVADILYDSGNITFKSSPRIDTDDFLIRLTKGSRMNIKTMKHNFTSDLILNQKTTNKIRSQVEKTLDKMIAPIVKKLPPLLRKQAGTLKGSSLSPKLLAPAIDKETKRFRLSVNSSGTFSDPRVVLTKPRLSDPQKEIKKEISAQTKNLKDAAGKLINEKVEEAKRLAEQKKKEAQRLAEEKKRELIRKANAAAEKKKREAKKEAEQKAKQALKKKFGNKLPF